MPTQRISDQWRGVHIWLRGMTFSVQHGYLVAPELKRAGFEFVVEGHRWVTDSPHVVARCPELLRRAKGPARKALRQVIRLAAAEKTIARAAARLPRGYAEQVRETLAPPVAAAARDAVEILVGYDGDKATIRNCLGFSKSDSELGHTLHEVGVTEPVTAALALQLTWKYRAQLPPGLVAAAFPSHAHGPSADVNVPPTAPHELTMAQAEELAAMPVAIADDILESTVAILDARSETDMAKPPFLREARLAIARIEGGGTLLLVSKARKPLRLEIRTA